MAKKFYWLKLKQDFFELDETKLIEKMENGKDYLIFLLKLQLKSINTDGYLVFKNTIPYSEEMLATVTGTNIDIVRNAIKLFLQLGLMEKLDDGTLFMAEVQNLIGSEGESAERMRKLRERSKPSLCDENVLNGDKNVTIEIDIEKEIEIDIDIELDISTKEKEYINILKGIKNYPLDLNKDISYYKQLEDKYPQLDICEVAKNWAIYKLDKPIKKKDNPRSQLNTQCQLNIKWSRCLKSDSSRVSDKGIEAPDWFVKNNY